MKYKHMMMLPKMLQYQKETGMTLSPFFSKPSIEQEAGGEDGIADRAQEGEIAPVQAPERGVLGRPR